MNRRGSGGEAPAAAAIKPVIKTTSMTAEMQDKAIECTIEAIKQKNNEQEIANHIKVQFEEYCPGMWHVFVGRNFGCYVTHEKSKFIYFYVGQVGVSVLHILMLVRISVTFSIR